MSKRILFVRHGESTANRTKEFHDAPRAKLTPKGKFQARRAGETLANMLSWRDVIKGIKVYCSPYARAIETCEIALEAAEFHFLAINIEEEIRERSFAGLEGKTVSWGDKNKENSITEQESRELWIWNSQYSRKHGVETLAKLRIRVENFLKKITNADDEGTIIVFSHGGFGRMMQAVCDEWPEDNDLGTIKFLENGEIVEYIYPSVA